MRVRTGMGWDEMEGDVFFFFLFPSRVSWIRPLFLVCALAYGKRYGRKCAFVGTE
jgi:hypothetical protein